MTSSNTSLAAIKEYATRYCKKQDEHKKGWLNCAFKKPSRYFSQISPDIVLSNDKCDPDKMIL